LDCRRVTATPDRRFEDAIARAIDHAPYLKAQLERRPELAALLAAGDVAAALTAARTSGESLPVARALRREKQGLALVLAIGDLAGAFTLEEVTHALSAFADRSLHAAIAAAIEERTPGEPPRGFAALALGKHGSFELNYSSDIDPILIFDPATLPRRARDEPVEAAARIARRAVEILQARDGDGYVFRVDLRLRPSPEITPPALPIDAAIAYYESSALPWERAAFIRARACAGDIALGQAFLGAVRPFVWRRSLDFGAVREIRDISRRIRDHHAQGQRLGPGYDLKRGRGGIREVEFFAQIHQLIHGGRDPALRVPATVDALRALAHAGRIDQAAAIALEEAYRTYRMIEHRLQMVDDRQTHSLPKDRAALDNIAALHGLADSAALETMLRPKVEAVGRIYDDLDSPHAAAQLSHDPLLLDAALIDAGFADPAHARRRIEAWRGGTVPATRGPAAREAFEAMLPHFVHALGLSADPMAALNRFDDVVTRLPSAIGLFRLLEAQPALARLLADILGHAPALADALGRNPAMLDGLIDASAFAPLGDADALAAVLRAGEAGEDYQAVLDRVRRQVGEMRFALGVQIVAGVADPLDVAAGYARLAEAALRVLADATIAGFEAVHGRVAGSDFVILAMGRLGGGALTHASDLDLVYLFTGDFRATSDGAKPLGATQYFNRLAPRVTAALSVPTAAGALYEVDTRLRPSGAKGLLAASLDSFVRYHAEEAWTWERMALTRARPVYGPPEAQAQVAAEVARALSRPRDPAILRADAAAMRADMARHKPAAGPFDVKLIGGGLVDLEFCVHLTQLQAGMGLDPNVGRALRLLAAEELVPETLIAAHDLLTRLLVTLRLVSPRSDEPVAASRAVVARACGHEDWPALLAAYGSARQDVGEAWASAIQEA
jgi:glutamate-ammonia-ligase adenylyltransferase